MKKAIQLIKRRLIGMMILITAIITSGCSNQELPDSETLVLTVDDSKVYLDELMYHVLLAELQGQLYASFFESEEEYWQTLDDKGITMAETTKKVVMDNAIKYEILYQMATGEGYGLTEEEKEISQNQVDSILQNVKLKENAETEFTKEKLLEIQNKIELSTRYYQDYLQKLGVNEDEIRAQFAMEEYIQYDIQYIFVSTMTLNEQQKVVPMKDEEKAQALSDLSSLQDATGTADDITLLPKNPKLTAGYLSYTENEDIFGDEFILEDVIRLMKVGETSDIIETVKGYYLIKLVDNTSTKKYDAAIRQALEAAGTQAFELAFEELKKEHKIKIKNRVWDSIQIGDLAQ